MKDYTVPSIIDHTSISVFDFNKSLEFYDETLKILGYERLMTFEKMGIAGYGILEKPSFWISSSGDKNEEIGRARGVHIAFKAPSADAVDQWHEAAVQLGGTCNGKPGPRPEYHPAYYGVFIFDINGWRIEACFHNFKP